MVTKQEKRSLHSERLGNGHILKERLEKNGQGELKRRDGTQKQQPVITKSVHVAGVGWASLVSMTMLSTRHRYAHVPTAVVYRRSVSAV